MRQTTTTVPRPRNDNIPSDIVVHLEGFSGTTCGELGSDDLTTQRIDETTCLDCWAHAIREVRNNLGLSRREVQESIADLAANSVWRVEQFGPRNRSADDETRKLIWQFLVGRQSEQNVPHAHDVLTEPVSADKLLIELQQSNAFYLRVAQDAIIETNRRGTTFARPFTRRWMCHVIQSYPHESACNERAPHQVPWECGVRYVASMTEAEFGSYTEEMMLEPAS